MSNPLKIRSSICKPQALNQRDKNWQEQGAYLISRINGQVAINNTKTWNSYAKGGVNVIL